MSVVVPPKTVLDALAFASLTRIACFLEFDHNILCFQSDLLQYASMTG
jgi:hypothetical protein